MDIERLKQDVCHAIDRHRDEILEVGETILRHPELGFKEEKTAALVAQVFGRMGLAFRDRLAVTGVKTVVSAHRDGPTVAVLGELDSLLCPDYPYADPETGAAHNCGHYASVAAMIGVGWGLVDSGALEHLSGRVALFAVPAEEYVEIAFRQGLRARGLVQFLAGKSELLRLGEFDDIDLAMMVHALSGEPGRRFVVGGRTNGLLVKSVRYRGRPAHSGGAPWDGVNALNAALGGLMNIHMLRETFREEDCVRVHGIITKGGDVVNIVPHDVRLEMHVRATALDTMQGVNAAVNRALQAGAMAVGADLEIQDLPGYLPLFQDDRFSDVFARNATALVGVENVARSTGTRGVTTDMGDVSHFLPAIHPMIGGFEGYCHTESLRLVDPEMAFLIAAKAMATTIVDLLAEDARGAREILAGFQPRLTKEQYLALWP